MDNNNKDSEHGKLTPLERLKNATSDEEVQREFDNILEENRKAMDNWFRVAMFGDRENKKD